MKIPKPATCRSHPVVFPRGWCRLEGLALRRPDSLEIGCQRCCGPPCRYVKRKGGCRDGQSCNNCHQCFWVGKQVPPASDTGRQQEVQVNPKTRRPDRQVPMSSVGTVGHPLTCAAPCMEAWQPGGCSRGSAC
ncbi:Cacna1h, partial [Symbiodinium sp. CCMP2456]